MLQVKDVLDRLKNLQMKEKCLLLIVNFRKLFFLNMVYVNNKLVLLQLIFKKLKLKFLSLINFIIFLINFELLKLKEL